jgi:hypothetical protein
MTAAWTWDAFVAVTMQSGFAVAGVRNFGFRAEDAKTDANDGELRVTRNWFGMDAVRHWRKLSEEAWVERKKKLEIMSIARAMIFDESIELELHDSSTKTDLS